MKLFVIKCRPYPHLLGNPKGRDKQWSSATRQLYLLMTLESVCDLYIFKMDIERVYTKEILNSQTRNL